VDDADGLVSEGEILTRADRSVDGVRIDVQIKPLVVFTMASEGPNSGIGLSMKPT
jgi:hypothetical protein